MVIVDSDVWIHYLNRPDSEPGEELQGLLDRNEVMLVGPVLSELLQGARDSTSFDRLLGLMRGVAFTEATRQTWVLAGQLSGGLRRSGQTTALMDIVIAAIALERDHEVYSLDNHFTRIPGLRLYKPEGA